MALESALHQLFCHNLRSIRKASKLTQVEVAERMGISQPQYNDLENGKYAPTLGTIEKSATALGVKADELLAAKKFVAKAS